MANESQLRPSEIKDVLLSEIENYEEELHAEEVGEVLEVKDGVARIYGLTKAMASEITQLAELEVVVDLPDVARSLSAMDNVLKARLEQGGGE